MRIRRLDLDRYGRFTDAAIEFGEVEDGAPDIHVVYGPNEAGKSTAVNALLDVFFGIEPRSRYNFRHAYKEMRVGAVLETERGPLTLARIKRNRDDLIDADDRPVDPAVLGTALHGLGRDGYRAMFCLDDQTLEDGGEEILASRGDAGRLLFSAAAGLAELTKGLDRLRDEAAEFHAPRKQGTELRRLVNEMREADEERRALDMRRDEWDALCRARDAAAAALDAARADRDASRTGRDAARRLAEALPVLGDLQRLEAEMAPLAGLPRVPEDWRAEAEALRDRVLSATARAGETARALSRLREEAAALPSDAGILAARPAVAALDAPAARDSTAAQDLPKREEERERLAARIAGVLAGLGRAGADPGTTRLPDDRLAALDRLSAGHPAIAGAVTAAGREAAAAEAALAEARQAAEAEAPPPEAAARLGRLVARLRTEDPLAAARTAREAIAREDARLGSALEALTPWQGGPEKLAPAPISAAEARALAEEDAARRAEAAAIAARIAERRAALAAADAGIAAEEGADGPPGDAVAAETRAARDAAWQAHRARLDAGTAETFERAMAEDDRVSAARLAAADRLAERRRIEAERTRLAAALAADEAAAEAIAAAREAAAAKLAPVLEALGLPGEMPVAGLPDWLGRQGEARARLADLATARAALSAAETEAGRQAAALAAALTAAGETVPDALPLDALRDMAETAAEAARLAAERAAAARAALAKAERDREARAHERAEAGIALSEWQAAWDGARAGLWCAEHDPAAMRDLLPGLRDLAGLMKEEAELGARIAAMRRDRQVYADAVATLADRLGAPAGSPAERHAGLSARLAAAEAAERRRGELGRAIAEAEEVAADLSREIAAAETRAAEMAAPFDGLRAIASAADLPGAIGEAREAAGLAARIAGEEARLLRLLGAATRAEAETMLEGATGTALAEGLDAATAAAADADAAVDAAVAALSEADGRLEAAGGDDRAARLTERREAILGRIAEGADRALALTAGLAAADTALARYRDRHRSAMLAHTAEAFREMTGGAFADLKTEADGRTERLIALRADGGSLGAGAMSKGTRFQLYLALRIAGYRRFAGEAGPLPFLADDVMETFDDDRAGRAIDLLAGLARYGQAIYFTHHRHLCAIARERLGDAVRLHEIPR